MKPGVLELESRRLLTAGDVLTYHNDPGSTGVNPFETELTPSSVSVDGFGRQFVTSLDGQVYAQPLMVSGVSISRGPMAGTHDVVLAATEHDSLYAIDAHTGDVLWKTSFLDPGHGITTVPSGDTGTGDLVPEIGITGTPVIDPATNILYLVAKTKEIRAGTTHYVQTLHAIDITSGDEALNGPVVIADTQYDFGAYTYQSGPFVFGNGDGNQDGKVYYNALREAQRPGLTLAGGRVYVASASHGDNGPYHGWVLGFDVATLQLTAAFNTTPNGGLGGIWQSGGSVAVDDQGYLYFETGNGTFDEALDAEGFPSLGDYGDSFVKLAVDPTSDPDHPNLNGWGLKVVDYFTPFNEQYLEDVDADLGSGGLTILPDAAGSSDHPHLLIGSGKEGKIYLVDRDHMGKFDPNSDDVVQVVTGQMNGVWSSPAYFDGSLYYVAQGDVARRFAVSSATIGAAPDSLSPLYYAYPGSTPSISADGDAGAIVWTLDRGTNQLRALDAADLGRVLYTSDQAPGHRDRLGSVVKFTSPTVAHGMVFVGTAESLVGYAVIPPPTAPPAPPSSLVAVAVTSTVVSLSWTDNSDNESGFLIERSDDGSTFTTVGQAGRDAHTISVGGLQPLTTYEFRVRATNLLGASDPTDPAEVTTPGGITGGLDFAAGFAGAGATMTLNGSATLVDNSLQITDLNYGEAGSAFSTDRLDITRFATEFTFQVLEPGADGFTFTIQGNDPQALGYGGGSLGYETIGNSVAIKFDIYDNGGEGLSSTGLYVDGAAPFGAGSIDLDGSGIDFHAERPIAVAMLYQDGTLRVTLRDLGTGASLSQSYPVDIPAHVGGTTAYVGFTGGTGGLTAFQDILRWVYAPATAGGLVAPSLVVARPVSATEASVSWTDLGSGQTGFKVKRRTDTEGYTVVATLDAQTDTFQDSGLELGTTYYYRVAATDGTEDSLDSLEAIVTIPTIPLKPGDSRAARIAPRQIDLAWTDNATNEDGYKIFRRTGTGTFELIATLPPDTQSYRDRGLLPDTLYDYHIQAYNTSGFADFTGVTVTTPPIVLPEGWEDADVGNPAKSGYATYDSGTFTVRGSGNDIWDQADNFHYVYRPLYGDGTIVARVARLTPTDPWAKAGVMIRQSLDSNAAHADVVVTPGNGVVFEYRAAAGDFSNSPGGVPGAVPRWVRLVRQGNLLTGSVSADGQDWTQVGQVTIPMDAPVYVGLALTSRDDGLNATAEFANVSLVPAFDPGGRAINAGGGDEDAFHADSGFVGGQVVASSRPIDTTGVRDPAPQAVYQTLRYGELTYTLANLLPRGHYTVRLHFAEDFYDQPGQRRFNVAINDTPVLTDYDIVAAAGGAFRAVVPEFVAVADANGLIRIEFTRGSVDLPQVNGIEVILEAATAALEVSSSAPVVKYGEPVTFTATVGSEEAGLPTPTGSVQFLVDGVATGPAVRLVDGVAASGQLSMLTPGSRAITARFTSDDGVYLPAEGELPGGQAIQPADTQSLLTANVAAPVYGDGQVFTVVIGAVIAGLPLPAGNVRFQLDGDDLGDLVPLTNGVGISALVGSMAAGPHRITASYLGDDRFAPSPEASLDVSVGRATLTAAAEDAGRLYGRANPAFVVTLAGVRNGDPIRVSVHTGADPSSPVGRYDVMPELTAPAGVLDNYQVTIVAGGLTVSPAALVVSVDHATRPYGRENPAFTSHVTGLAPGDPISVSYQTSAGPASAVGDYPVIPTLVAPGGLLANYHVQVVEGRLSVARAALSVTATDQERLYGMPNPELTAVFAGLRPGEPIHATLTTRAIATSPVGTYPITVELSDPGGRLGNYEVTVKPGTLTITEATSSPPPSSIMAVGVGTKAGPLRQVQLAVSGTLDPTKADDRANYRLVYLGTDRKLGTRDDRGTQPRSVRYDAAAGTITLTLGGRLVWRPTARLRLLASGLEDAQGQPLDGDHDGRPGGAYVLMLTRGLIGTTRPRFPSRHRHQRTGGGHPADSIVGTPGSFAGP